MTSNQWQSPYLCWSITFTAEAGTSRHQLLFAWTPYASQHSNHHAIVPNMQACMHALTSSSLDASSSLEATSLSESMTMVFFLDVAALRAGGFLAGAGLGAPLRGALAAACLFEPVGLLGLASLTLADAAAAGFLSRESKCLLRLT